MKIAMPITDGVLCPHFGNCQQFAFIDVDQTKKEILNIKMMTPPPHQPGLLPIWINQQGCDLIITGGMGNRAQNIFHEYGIEVVTGVQSEKPEDIITAYFNSSLSSGGNLCDEPAFKADGGHHDCGRHSNDV